MWVWVCAWAIFHMKKIDAKNVEQKTSSFVNWNFLFRLLCHLNRLMKHLILMSQGTHDKKGSRGTEKETWREGPKKKQLNLIKNSYLSHQHNSAERRSKFMIPFKRGRNLEARRWHNEALKAIVVTCNTDSWWFCVNSEMMNTMPKVFHVAFRRGSHEALISVKDSERFQQEFSNQLNFLMKREVNFEFHSRLLI